MNEYLKPFITLSYPVPPPANPDSFPNSSYYGIGIKDACFVVTTIAVLAILREVVRLYLLEPFARSWLSSRAAKQGISTPQRIQSTTSATPDAKKLNETNELLRSRSGKSVPARTESSIKLEKITKQRHKGMTKEQWLRERSVLRFAEQGWAWVYFCISWSVGFYLHMNFPHSLWNLEYLWKDYPHRPLPGIVKLYYLVQLGSWLHQMLTLNAEARRKDHWQMMSHHVISITLIISSYLTNFTRIGCLILVLMDWCDIWLPFAKMLKYLRLSNLPDVAFVIFLVSWLITRQILFLLVIISTIFEGRRIVPDVWDPVGGRFLNRDWYFIFSGLLVTLQIIICVWFVEICTVAWGVISGQVADDPRSDEEGESPEEDEQDASKSTIAKPTSARDEPKRKAR